MNINFHNSLIVLTILLSIYSCKIEEKLTLREYFISSKMAKKPVGEIIESYDLIQLEETEGAFFRSARRVFFTEDKIIMLTNDSRILIFSYSGEFIGSIDKQGRGPDEYIMLSDICYDNNEGKILGSCSNEVLWFNTGGDILKRMDTGFRFNNVHLTEQDRLLFDIRIPGEHKEFNYNQILTDSDLNIIDHRIELPILEGPGLAVYGQLCRTSGMPGKDYFFSLLCDTVYRIKNDRIVPDIVFNYDREVFSVTNGTEDPDFENRYSFIMYLETSNYIVLVFRDENLEAYTAVAGKSEENMTIYKGSIGDMNITNTNGNSLTVLANPSMFTTLIDMYDPDRTKCTNPEMLKHYLENPEEISSLLIKINIRYP